MHAGVADLQRIVNICSKGASCILNLDIFFMAIYARLFFEVVFYKKIEYPCNSLYLHKYTCSKLLLLIYRVILSGYDTTKWLLSGIFPITRNNEESFTTFKFDCDTLHFI